MSFYDWLFTPKSSNLQGKDLCRWVLSYPNYVLISKGTRILILALMEAVDFKLVYFLYVVGISVGGLNNWLVP